MSPRLSPRANEYARIWADFARFTKDHVLTVHQDDSLNRRMRVGAPDTGIYSWTVVTWPGHLQVVGDIADGYGFRRVDDMISFFDGGLGWEHADGAPSIDFRYWAEKLTGGRSHDVMKYSDRTFIQAITERLDEHEDLGADARQHHDRVVLVAKTICGRYKIDYDEYVDELRVHGAAGVRNRYPAIDTVNDEEDEYFGQPIPVTSPRDRRNDLIADARLFNDSEHEAYSWLQRHTDVFGDDIFEIGMRDYDVHFILACYAIALTVKLWREYEALESTKRERSLDDYIWVEGGLVQNSPRLPVFDIDVLDSGDADALSEVTDLYERITAHPRAVVGMAQAVKDAVTFVHRHGTQDDIDWIDELEAARLGKTTAAA